jgi:hypothetical protein
MERTVAPRREADMVTAIEKVIQELQSLGAAGPRGLRRVVHERLSNLSDPADPELEEDEFKRRLVAAGIRCRSRASHGPRQS